MAVLGVLAAALPYITAAASIGSTVYSIYSGEQQKGEAKKQERKIEAASTAARRSAEAAEQKERAALYAKMRTRSGGRGGTLLTGGRGVKEEASTVGGALRSTLGGA